ncbi:Retinol dehydrogenase 12 [Tolypocladium ophioglossoides CBS 100239]|uniref:Retinol dehydrogenase 12 n=1 Tax=Tolypocladium ophioglossoides (strain CBS 100239) TaxID=1163406 RepID=A0A0L0NHP7_TOLOC|nr:Retinol dehydrogenase 12 [Tolypocladium ophioglossoides CBS 100239]
MSAVGWVKSQFSTLPYPDEDCSGRSVIITGANSGLGLEAARHFVRLNAAKVILACRSIERGEAAKQEIESSTPRRHVLEVWQLDLGSFDSVKEFAARAAKLDRLDVLLNSASILVSEWARLEGHETMMTVNVISTMLLTVLLLPTLRRTGTRFNVTPHVTIVSSGAAFLAFFPEKEADHVLDRLKENKNYAERYNTTKLLQLIMMLKLAEASDASGKGHVIVNALDPGLCRTQLFRRWSFPLSWIIWFAFSVLGRDPEMGSRTLVAAALAGEETHGRWMSDCTLQVWPKVMEGKQGERLADKIWGELAEVLEGIEPGVMENV